MGYKRAKESNRRLKKRYEKYGNYYGSGVWYNEDEDRYIEYHAPRRAKYIRNRANRKVRRSKNFEGQHGDFKKVYDVWWEIW